MADEIIDDARRSRRAVLFRGLKIAAWLVPILVIVILAGLELRGRGQGQGALSVADYQARAEVVDTPAPDFELSLLGEDGSLRLSDLRGDVVVLNFWASWCSPCRIEAPDLEAAWQDYRDRGVQFVGVDELDDKFAAGGFVREFAITYPSVFDPSGSLADDYAFIGLPATFVIDRQGNVVYRFQGFIDGPTLRSSLDEVLAATES